MFLELSRTACLSRSGERALSTRRKPPDRVIEIAIEIDAGASEPGDDVGEERILWEPSQTLSFEAPAIRDSPVRTMASSIS